MNHTAITQAVRRTGALALSITAIAWLAACQTTPPRNFALEEARKTYNEATANPEVARRAQPELAKAREALFKAEHAWAEDRNEKETAHLAYLATQQSQVALNVGVQRAADNMVTAAGPERERAQADARSRDVQVALATQAQNAQANAQSAQARADQLEKELADLSAKQTNRGLVVVLQDVLFDVGQASLLPGAQVKLERMAGALQRHPERHVLVEGFTDSTGSQQLNQNLSEQRAEAVRTALTRLGVSADRIDAKGHGPDLPVASNDTASGRQQNRRVEILISNADGRFATP